MQKHPQLWWRLLGSAAMTLFVVAQAVLAVIAVKASAAGTGGSQPAPHATPWLGAALMLLAGLGVAALAVTACMAIVTSRAKVYAVTSAILPLAAALFWRSSGVVGVAFLFVQAVLFAILLAVAVPTLIVAGKLIGELSLQPRPDQPDI